MKTTEALLEAFNEFDNAAFAMAHCQLSNVGKAAERLETARKTFHELFMQGVRDEAKPEGGRGESSGAA